MGVLEDPVEMAGRTQVRPPPEDEESDSDKTKLRFQHHLADALERRRAHLLDTDFKRLPSIVLPGYAAGRGSAADPRLSAWMACDKVSRSVVHTHPTKDWAPTCAEFAEILSNYLGADSPLAARLGVGKVLRESRNTRVNPISTNGTASVSRTSRWRATIGPFSTTTTRRASSQTRFVLG